MKYSKPIITILGDAVRVIRFEPKSGVLLDAVSQAIPIKSLTPAYDLDE